MAPLPANNTARYFFRYSCGGVNHKLIVRCTDEIVEGTISDVISTILDAIGDEFFASAAVGMDYQPSGSDFSVPATYTGLVTTWGSGSPADSGTPMFAGMAGRGSDGRRNTWHLFGFKRLGDVLDYRFNVSADAAWNEALAAIVAADGMFLTIGGTKAVYHPYVNVGVNAYWQRKMRTV